MRNFVAVASLLTFGAAGCAWFADDGFAFTPETGDTRYFVVEQSTRLQPADDHRGASTRIRMESVLRSEVLDVRDDVVELKSDAIKAVEHMRGRTLVDTESEEQQSRESELLADFLQSGVIENVSPKGVPVDAVFQNTDALNSVEVRPEALQLILRRSLSVFSWYPPQFPDKALALGVSWQTENRELDGAVLPGLNFEVTHIDDHAVTLEFSPIDPDASPTGDDSSDPSFRVTGYLQLERSTGWPRQAGAQISADVIHGGQNFQVTSQLNVRQPDVDYGPDTERLLSMAKMSQQTRPVDATSPVFDKFFLPPFTRVPAGETLARIDRTLLWFGTGSLDYGYGRGAGAESQVNASNLQGATIHPLKGVRLLDADGKSVQRDLLPNPDFRLLRSSDGRSGSAYAGIPFLRQGMTADQLASIDLIELDIPVTRREQSHSVFISKGDTANELEHAGLKLTVAEWSPEKVRVHVSRENGIPPGALPNLMGYPVDESGEPLSRFGLRMTHSLFESVLGAMKDPRLGQEALASALFQSLSIKPPHEKNGDFIFEFTGTGSNPIERLKFHYYDTRKETMTFSAPAAKAVLDGSEVAGERTLYEGNVPRFNLASRSNEDQSYRMERVSLPVSSAGSAPELEQSARGTLRISEELFDVLLNVQSAFDLKRLPLVAFNEQGEALVPLWHEPIGEMPERLDSGEVQLRFWGDLDSVSYPVSDDNSGSVSGTAR